MDDDCCYSVWRQKRPKQWRRVALLDLDRKSKRSSGPLRVGIVVGTFAAVPYVHLQLESWRRNYPGIPLLVHDDASHRQHELISLCLKYGADFQTNRLRRCDQRHLGHDAGDLSVFLGGLSWAASRGLDLVVKVSRRFVPLVNWVDELQKLGVSSRATTFGSYYLDRSDSLRTDCIGLRVHDWVKVRYPRLLFSKIIDCLTKNDHGLFVEHVIFKIAPGIKYSGQHRDDCFARWPFVTSTLKGDERPTYLWHEIHRGGDYYRISNSWGLRYSLSFFEGNPNI